MGDCNTKMMIERDQRTTAGPKSICCVYQDRYAEVRRGRGAKDRLSNIQTEVSGSEGHLKIGPF